jgi:hypothetical protein
MPFYKFKVVKSCAGEELPDLNEQAFLWIGELADAFPEKEFLLLHSGSFNDGVEAFLEFQCEGFIDVQEVADILFDEEQYDPDKVRVWPAEAASEEQIIEVWFSGLSEEEDKMIRIF